MKKLVHATEKLDFLSFFSYRFLENGTNVESGFV